MQYDTLLVSRPENIRYLSGFTGEGTLLVEHSPRPDDHRGDPLFRKGYQKILITDARYALRAKAEQQRGVQIVVVNESFSETLVATLKSLRTQRLGFEASHLTVARLAALKKQTQQLKLKFVSTIAAIEKQREVKTTTELKLIQAACRITVAVLAQTVESLRWGQTELAVAEQFRRLAFAAGVPKLAFDSIVAFGAHTAIPHHQPGERQLRKGDVALFDVGVRHAGYCSDMTRTFFTVPPTQKQREVYEAVQEAQLAGVAAVRPQVQGQAIDAVVRQSLKRAGFAEYFTHSTGHGVGLEIHEQPSLSPKSKDILKVGQVITVEPGVYLSGEFGVRIEDTVAVTKTGAKILTESSKTLTVLKI